MPSVTISPVRTDNAIFQTERMGRPEILVVNRGLADFAHPELFAWHLSIAIPAQALDENALPTAEELGPLNETSDAVTAFVLESRTERDAPNILFLAQSTWAGTRELIFRVHDSDAALLLLSKKTFEKWARDWEFQLSEDPEWKLARPITGLFGKAERAEGWQAF